MSGKEKITVRHEGEYSFEGLATPALIKLEGVFHSPRQIESFLLKQFYEAALSRTHRSYEALIETSLYWGMSDRWIREMLKREG